MTETEHHLITGDKFIAELLKLGIVDNKTESIMITACVGEVITLDIRKFGDDRMLTLLRNGGLAITKDPGEAIAK